MQGQQQKKASDDHVKKMAKGLLANHDKIGGALGADDVAATFASTDDMEGISAGLGDVSALAPEQDTDDEEEKDEDEEDEQDEKEKEKENKRRKFFDRDRVVVKASKQLEAATSKLRTSASKALEDLNVALAKVKALPAQDQVQFRGEVSIGVSRHECLGKLFSTDVQLADHIKAIKNASCSSGSQASSTDPMKALGTAPPCKNFEELCTFDELEKICGKVLEASCNDEIEQVKKTASNARAPTSDLISACKSATADINKGLKAHETNMKKAAVKPSKQAVTNGREADAFAVTGHCKQVMVVEEGAFQAAHVDSPCLIRCNEAKQRAFEMSEAVKRFMVSDFLQVFNAQAGAQKCERAHRRLPVNSDVRAAAISRMRELCPNASPDLENVQGKEETFQCMEAVAVIVAKNSLSCSPEKSYTGPCCKNVFIHVSKNVFPKCIPSHIRE